jgi:phosphoglycolate phosphatase
VGKHIIFDLDGTLIDSKHEITETYRKVVGYIPPDSPIVFEAINFGATLHSVLQGIYNDNTDMISKAKLMFSEIYDTSSYKNTLLYPDVAEVLDYLCRTGYSLYIATNKRLKPTIRILEKKSISPYFKQVKASDMVSGILISKEQMVKDICEENTIGSGYIAGDSLQDIEAGQALGLETIAVTYGYEKKDNLIKKNPTFVIHTLTELYNIL